VTATASITQVSAHARLTGVGQTLNITPLPLAVPLDVRALRPNNWTLNVVVALRPPIPAYIAASPSPQPALPFALQTAAIAPYFPLTNPDVVPGIVVNVQERPTSTNIAEWILEHLWETVYHLPKKYIIQIADKVARYIQR